MKKIILVFICLCLAQARVHAQAVLVNDSLPTSADTKLNGTRWKFFLTPFAIVGRELAVGAELRYNQRQAINFLVGYRYAYHKDNGGFVQTVPYFKQWDDYDYHNVLNQYLSGIHIESCLKYYFGRSKLASWSTGVFMRTWMTKDLYYQYDNEHGASFNTKRTEQTYVGGIKMLMGREFPIYQFYNGNIFYVEMYGGGSVRYKRMYYRSEGGHINDVSITTVEERKNKIVPGVQAGVRVGIAFKQKH